ncbi:MAG: DUF2796 domain-containing protein [Rhodocyclaceae bacterium]|nr:DUF2796 domain-containing protein [Rhodocyclaceae bacterium]
MKHSLLLVFLLSAATATLAQHRHVHGEGRLEAVLDKDTLTLNLELPLDAAVGFERAPKNDREKAALTAAERILNDPALFRPVAAAQCSVQSVQVGMPAFDGSGGGHADIDATHAFRCANPAALTSVETTLFKSMKRLYRLEAQRVGPGGQGAQRLTPNKPALNW